MKPYFHLRRHVVVGRKSGLYPSWSGCAPFPLTLTLSLRERELLALALGASARPTANTATESPMTGERFSLSLGERAGVRGKSANDYKTLGINTQTPPRA
jgi:hypothetical protein